MNEQLIRLLGMVVVGTSVGLLANGIINFFIFLIIWVVGWFIYDIHFNYQNNN